MEKELLIVEDEMFIGTYLKEKLEELGYKVHTALNGKEALKVVQSNKLDLIVTDVVMPIMDGVTFCEELKKNEVHSRIPVIASTAWTNKEPQLKEQGVQHFIYKPYDVKDLNSLIRKVLEPMKKLTASKRVVAVGESFQDVKKVIEQLQRDGWLLEFKFIEVADCLEELILDLSYMQAELILLDSDIQSVRFADLLQDVLQLSEGRNIPLVIYNINRFHTNQQLIQNTQAFKGKFVQVEKLNKINLALIIYEFFV